MKSNPVIKLSNFVSNGRCIKQDALGQKIRAFLLDRFGVTQEEFARWNTKDYSIKKEVTQAFFTLVEDAEKIFIIGDYDCDGICATHILRAGLASLYPDKTICIRTPRRFTEGYGINENIIQEVISAMIPEKTLLITCDNGIAAGNVLSRAKKHGIKVIVTDHHNLDVSIPLPDVDLIVNPVISRLENPLNNTYYCGAGVVYKILENKLPAPLKRTLKHFAALATVADVVPLKEENWVLVREFLRDVRTGQTDESILMLLAASDKPYQYTDEDTLGFVLGPIFNAAGRLMDDGPMDVLTYLSNPSKEHAEGLVSVNAERKELVKNQFDMVERYIEEHSLKQTCPIWVQVDGLHEGVVGIVAGRIAEKYHKPVIVLTWSDEKQCLKGSARTYEEFDIYKYLWSMKDSFISFGGHPEAAGLSLKKELFETCAEHVTIVEEGEDVGSFDLDIESMGNIALVNDIFQEFRPFGQGNKKPVLKISLDTDFCQLDWIGSEENHMSVEYNGIKLIAFSKRDEYNKLRSQQKFAAYGTIGVNVWRDKATTQFSIHRIEDLQ